MNERMREWIQWAILLFFVFLPAWLCDMAVREVLYWMVTSTREIMNMLQAPSWASSGLSLVIWHGGIFAFFFVSGFAYCWLMDEEWRKSALISWLIFLAFDNAGRVNAYGIAPLIAGWWFYAESATSCASSFFGAWLASRNRYNPKLVAVRDVLFNTVVIRF